MVEADTAIIIGFVIVAVIVTIGVMAARYKKVPPDKAMVVYGHKMGNTGIGYKVISGGGKFIIPVLESYEFLPLDVRTLDVHVNDIVTDVATSGAKINIKSVPQVKVYSGEIAMKTLEGHVRGVCATMTIESINSDRDQISSRIQTHALNDLMNMGISRSIIFVETLPKTATGKTDPSGVV